MAESIFISSGGNENSVKVREKLHRHIKGIVEISKAYYLLEKLTMELKESESKLKQINANERDKHKSENLRERKEDLLQRKSEVEYKISDIQDRIGVIVSRLKENKRQETILNDKVERFKKGRAVSSLANRYLEAAKDIRDRAAVKLRETMSAIVTELWIDIIDRRLEYQSLEFDEYWNCKLRKKSGGYINWESVNTSAGQRQVRVLAFTEALRRLAKQIPPLVVDTPLARLDKEVKKNVLNRLYLSGHQSIILATDSEIEPEGKLFEDISCKLSRVYTLNPEGNPQSQSYHVRVSRDYFNRVL